MDVPSQHKADVRVEISARFGERFLYSMINFAQYRYGAMRAGRSFGP